MTIFFRGTHLTWSEIKERAESIRRQGIHQFIEHYPRMRAVKTPDFLWGDEIECMLFRFDDSQRRVRVKCAAEALLHFFHWNDETANDVDDATGDGQR